jgi:hypothetical protein
LADLKERCERANTRVVDENVEPAQKLYGFLDQPLDLPPHANVSIDCQGAAFLFVNCIHYFRGLSSILVVINDDIGALDGKSLGNGPADSSRASGDQRSFSL